MGWVNPRPDDYSPEALRAILRSLEDFLKNPTFDNGVSVGDGTGGTYDQATGTTTLPSLDIVDADTFSGIDTDLTALEADLAAADADLTALEARFPIQEVDIGDDQISTPKLQANSVTAAELAAINIAVGKYIASTSYSAGVSGWIAEADGSAEFNDVTVRGTVVAERFYGDADLIQAWTFTGSTESWTAQGGGSVSVLSDTLLVDDDGANTHPEVLSPLVSGVTPGRVYRVTLEGDNYADDPSSYAEEIRFYTSADAFISTGEWTESRQGNGVRSTIAKAPATAAKLAIYVEGNSITEFAIDNVNVYECPTLDGAVVDTRPSDEPDAAGVRVGQGVHLLKGATTTGSLAWAENAGGITDPWTGEGPMLASASEAASLLLTDDGDAVLDGSGAVYVGTTALDVRFGSDVDINVLGSWTPFTPTWNNVTLGTPNQASYGRYMRIGKTVWWQAGFRLGGGGVLAGTMSMTGPFTIIDVNGLFIFDQVGAGYAYDLSAGNRYPATFTSDPGTTTWCFRPVSAASTGFAAAVPFTWAGGDEFHASGCFEIA